jgi:hypothetical protein
MRGVTRPISEKRPLKAKGTVNAVPNKQRQNAIASAGAVVNAISGPDAEIPISAIDSRATTLGCGRMIAELLIVGDGNLRSCLLEFSLHD